MGHFNKDGFKALILTSGKIELLETVIYITENDDHIAVGKGYITDLASIPRFAWRICGGPRYNNNARAGLVHDWIYQIKAYDRKRCDEIFYEILRSEGKNWITSKIMYYVVRWFGGSHY